MDHGERHIPNAGPEVFAPGSSPDRGPVNLLKYLRPGEGHGSGREGDTVHGEGSKSDPSLKTDYTTSRLIMEVTNLRDRLRSAVVSMQDAFKSIDHRPERAKDILIAGIFNAEEVL